MLTDLIFYDLKVAALIAVFYLFYMLLLARETTHTLNRAVLLSGIALSVVLPLCIITFHHTEVVEYSLPSLTVASDVSAAMRGQAGTKVQLRLEREGREFDCTVTRREIKLPNVPYYGFVAGGDYGYINKSICIKFIQYFKIIYR